MTSYTLTFEPFDLSRDYDATYLIQKVPEYCSWSDVTLAIKDPTNRVSDESQKRSTAHIKIEVNEMTGLPGTGMRVLRVDHQLGKMYWRRREGRGYSLEVLDSYIRPYKGGQCKVTVHYTPDSQLAGLQGYVVLQSASTRVTDP